MEHFKDMVEHDVYGAQVAIYKRGDVGGNNWWYRLKITGVRGYIRRSSKTENASIAMRTATEQFENYKLRKQNNLSLDNYTVGRIFR